MVNEECRQASNLGESADEVAYPKSPAALGRDLLRADGGFRRLKHQEAVAGILSQNQVPSAEDG
jgi:hypothetical protein